MNKRDLFILGVLLLGMGACKKSQPVESVEQPAMEAPMATETPAEQMPAETPAAETPAEKPASAQ